MARIRTIKPEFWSHDKVVGISRDARLLFIGMWNFADDAGRLVESAGSLKRRIFPDDHDVGPAEINRWLDQIEASGRTRDNPGLIIRYEVDGVRIIQITGWEHQRIANPSSSKLPQPPIYKNSNSAREVYNSPTLDLTRPMEGVHREGRKEGEESKDKSSTAVAVVPDARARPTAAGRDRAVGENPDPKAPPFGLALDADAKPSPASDRAGRLFDQIAELALLDLARMTGANWAFVQGWLNAGFDEEDILGGVREVVRRRQYDGGNVRSLKYFDEAIKAVHRARRGLDAGDGGAAAATPPRPNDATARLPSWLWLERCGQYRVDQALKRFDNWGKLHKPYGKELDTSVAWTLVAVGEKTLGELIPICWQLGRDPLRQQIAEIGARIAAGEDLSAMERPKVGGR